jgi:hypothetical protein
MFGRAGALIAALTLGFTAASAAQARVIQFTVEGQVTRASGNAPIFGLPSADLVGLDYVAVFRFDPTLGNRLKSDVFESTFGGVQSGAPNPSLGGQLTINGVTVSLPGAFLGTVSTANGGASGATIQNLRDVDEFAGSHAVLYSEIRAVGANTLGTSLDAPFTYVVDPRDVVTSYYEFQTFEQVGCCLTVRSSAGTLKPRTIRFEPLGVPEPATWAVLVWGFGLAGGGLRRRLRRRPAHI